jgi:hypothetical protein
MWGRLQDPKILIDPDEKVDGVDGRIRESL